MAFLDSLPDIIAGVSVEALAIGVCLGVAYRFFSGKFLIPKREILLPNQNGIIVQGDQILRVVQPGPCWVRPSQRIILCDMRPRPLQMVAVEVICKDSGIIRFSLSGEYRIADAAAYFNASANANDAIFVALRRCIFAAARQQQSSVLVSAPEAFAAIVREAAEPEAAKLGLTITSLDIWEAIHIGWFRQPDSSSKNYEGPLPGSLIH